MISNVKVAYALYLLCLSDQRRHLSSQFLEFLNPHYHAHLLTLCCLYLNYHFWSQYLLNIVSRENNIDFPLAMRIVHGLLGLRLHFHCLGRF